VSVGPLQNHPSCPSNSSRSQTKCHLNLPCQRYEFGQARRDRLVPKVTPRLPTGDTRPGVAMSSYRFHQGHIPRPGGLPGSAQDTQPAESRSTAPSSGIPLPSRSQTSRTPASFFSRNRRNQNSGEEVPSRSYTGEHPFGTPRDSSSLSSRSSESTSKLASAESRSFGFRPSIKTVKPAEKEKLRNVLRRKAPSIDQTPTASRSRARSDASENNDAPVRGFRGSMSLPGGSNDPYPNTVFGIPLPPTSSIPTMHPASSPETSISVVPELANLKTHLPPKQNPSTPAISASVSSPSTRYSDSPGPWSRTSTPTSLSSYSPGIVQTVKIGPRTRQPSPAKNRPPVTRRKGQDAQQQGSSVEGGHGLPALRESVTSSSSSSTVKISDALDKDVSVKKQRKNLTPPPPSPPPRKSSMKFKSPKKETSAPLEAEQAPPEQAFPEFAHLKTTMVSPTRKDTPPSRPSREGTGDLDIRPSPIIQSNLSPLKVIGHHKRDSSLESLFTDAPPRHGPTPNQPIPTPSQTTRRPSRYPTQSPRDMSSTIPKPTVSPVPSSGKRFGLFSKRSKTVPEVPVADQDTKPARKGPAAGTGHEGYGKYSQRGRRTSIGSTSTRARSTSTSTSGSQTIASFKSGSSNKGAPEMDDFLRARLEPVIISGGGGRFNTGAEMARTGSNQSSASSQPTTSSATLSMGATRLLHLATQDTESQENERNFSSPEFNSNLMASSTKLQGATRTLADRRSLRRSQLFDGRDSLRHPLPINTQLLGSPPSLNSYDTSQSSLPQTDTTLPPSEEPLAKVDSRGSNKTEKTGRRLRWNFFQRTQSAEKKTVVPEPQPAPVTEMTATISRIPAMRPVAHYAMMDSSPDPSDTLEDLMQRIDESPQREENLQPNEPASVRNLKRQHGQSVLLPSPPNFSEFSEQRRPSSPKIQFRRDSEKQAEVERPSRLPQVGRIPRVISKRDHHHKPAVQSFSRPFTRAEEYYEREVDERPILGIQTDVLPSRPFVDADSGKPASAPAADIQRVLDPLAGEDVFLTFPHRKGSQVSTSTSSGMTTYAATTAVLPEPGSVPTEDEVWNEYDDLIDHVMSPTTSKTMDSSTSSQGFPFPYPGSRRVSGSERTSRPSERARDSKPSPILESSPSPTKVTTVTLSPLQTSNRSSASIRLRRSRILSALHSSIAPSTPMSVSELLAQYAEGNDDDDFVHRQSSSSTGRASMRSSHTRNTPVTSAGSDEISRQRNSVLMDMAERDREGPIAQSNLRFGALMTSRWLSFGRVLFSPAHHEIKNHRQDRILILDGLGNDDWSFYCAETYQTAIVYSLSLVAPPPFMRNRANPSVLQSPPNHRTIHHPSIGAPFPFPKGFFTAAIFRFPSAAPESALRSAICECRRVLRPGGFIELSVLDIDMLNMGPKTRRAVRDLRVRMAVADPDVSLKPAGDNIQRMLGRRGFENLNRCMVSIPVAGKIGTSEAGSRSSMDVDVALKNISLNEMLHDPSPAGDEGITKMVSRVGRWWFTRCYEWGVLPDDDLGRSIWADKAVIRECERMETGFRLLIAYAQKPDELVRRTVSV
jgi:hypothetical protein